jgi:glycosyltransferase involved in cell wall biosynthesis
MHQALAVENWNKNLISNNGNTVIRFTHNSTDLSKYVKQLSTVKAITVENTISKNFLVNLGIIPEIIHFLPHPVDTKFFQHIPVTQQRDVIFISTLTERKNPQLILDTIRFNQDVKFTIFGKGWQKWTGFNDLIKLKNLIYLEFDYRTYPRILNQHKIFCSLSTLEGGPVPLIEALSCKLNVVVTDTGHARDVIRHPKDYNIIPVHSDYLQVSNAIRMALSDELIISNDMGQYSYENYISRIKKLIYS